MSFYKCFIRVLDSCLSKELRDYSDAQTTMLKEGTHPLFESLCDPSQLSDLSRMLRYHRSTMHGLRAFMFVFCMWAPIYLTLAVRNAMLDEEDIHGSPAVHVMETIGRAVVGTCALNMVLMFRFSKDPTNVVKSLPRLGLTSIGAATAVSISQMIRYGYNLDLANSTLVAVFFASFPVLVVIAEMWVSILHLVASILAVVTMTIMEKSDSGTDYERTQGNAWTFCAFYCIIYTHCFYGVFSILMSLRDLFVFQKEANARLRKARDQAVLVRDQKSYFLNYASHELRTPLHGLMGMLDLAKDKFNDGDQTPKKREAMDALEVCLSTGQHLVDITSSLLAWGRADRNKALMMDGRVALRRGSFKNCVNFALNALNGSAQLGGVRLLVNWKGGKALFDSVEFDNVKTRQIVMNLVSNAIKYSPPGGDVVVTCQAASDEDFRKAMALHGRHRMNSQSTVQVDEEGTPSPQTKSCSNPGEHAVHLTVPVRTSRGNSTEFKEIVNERVVIHCTVKDSGNGVNPKSHREIFEEFVTSATDDTVGTGLGLPICRKLITLMGGVIWVESEGVQGKGSLFHFMLPVETRSGETTPLPLKRVLEKVADEMKNDVLTSSVMPRRSSATKAWNALTVLVVDDQALNLKLARHMLKALGHRSVLADNGVRALELFEAGLNAADRSEERIDVCLVDVQMPNMNGMQVYEALRAIEAKHGVLVPTPIAMTTAAHLAVPEPNEKDWFSLNKPFGRKDLREFLEDRARERMVARRGNEHLPESKTAPHSTAHSPTPEV